MNAYMYAFNAYKDAYVYTSKPWIQCLLMTSQKHCTHDYHTDRNKLISIGWKLKFNGVKINSTYHGRLFPGEGPIGQSMIISWTLRYAQVTQSLTYDLRSAACSLRDKQSNSHSGKAPWLLQAEVEPIHCSSWLALFPWARVAVLHIIPQLH